jgi:ketosteroid isomerase-like protein
MGWGVLAGWGVGTRGDGRAAGSRRCTSTSDATGTVPDGALSARSGDAARSSSASSMSGAAAGLEHAAAIVRRPTRNVLARTGASGVRVDSFKLSGCRLLRKAHIPRRTESSTMNPFDDPGVSPRSDRTVSREVDMSAASGSGRTALSGSGRAALSGSGRAALNDCMRAASNWSGRSGTSGFSRVVAGHCLIALALAGNACAPASDAIATDALADTLTQQIEAAYDFTRPDVVERMSALYPDTGRVISASGGYITTTADSLRQGLADFWTNVGVNMSDPRWEWGDVHVDRLSPDAAVLTATWSIPHIAPTGRPHTISGAWTAVFRRMGGEWKIIQEHLSVPPEMQ